MAGYSGTRKCDDCGQPFTFVEGVSEGSCDDCDREAARAATEETGDR